MAADESGMHMLCCVIGGSHSCVTRVHGNGGTTRNTFRSLPRQKLVAGFALESLQVHVSAALCGQCVVQRESSAVSFPWKTGGRGAYM